MKQRQPIHIDPVSLENQSQELTPDYSYCEETQDELLEQMTIRHNQHCKDIQGLMSQMESLLKSWTKIRP